MPIVIVWMSYITWNATFVREKIPTQANKLLAQVIENSNIVIDSYPNSKYVDDAYFIIGKASFLRQEFFNAEKHFKKLI